MATCVSGRGTGAAGAAPELVASVWSPGVRDTRPGGRDDGGVEVA